MTRQRARQVRRLVGERPDLALQLIQSLVQRVRTLTRTVRSLASVDVYGRLVGLFEAVAVDEKGQRVVPGPLSQQRIAERVEDQRKRAFGDMMLFVTDASQELTEPELEVYVQEYGVEGGRALHNQDWTWTGPHLFEMPTFSHG